MIFSTWHHHNQIFDKTRGIPISRLIPPDRLDPNDYVRGITNCFLFQNMRYLVGSDSNKAEKENKQAISTSTGIHRVEYVMEIYKTKMIFPTLDSDIMEDRWHDAMKSLVMKLVQLLLLMTGTLEYDKTQLPSKFDQFFSGHVHPGCANCIRWFLTRGRDGAFCKDCIDFLMAEYYRIANELHVEIDWIPLDLDLSVNPTKFSDDFWEEFVRTPCDPSHRLVQLFLEYGTPTGAAYLNDIFAEQCKNIDALRAVDPDFFDEHVEVVDTQSEEWRDMLSYYQCGRNTGINKPANIVEPEHYVRHFWNLIRGCIGESIGLTNVHLDLLGLGPVEKVTVGLLVSEKIKGAQAIAPDALFVLDSGKIVPIEVKCIAGKFNDNHDFRREVALARRQLQTSKDILGPLLSDLGGLIMLVYLDQNDSTISCLAGFV